ncbi:MAG: DUF421 domain-containing protein [Betaproteobacteria bacterium HGW-Betaproteobacteria-7]|jgi:uncharacterized membrane protein YcaP (DUF421 family)|nr:MAG: DUF421 domain-containing protein [Betaproteobacteria bacterium HGW-Betaproteobacteria-7]
MHEIHPRQRSTDRFCAQHLRQALRAVLACGHALGEQPVNFFDFDLTSIAYFTVSPLELMLRGTLLYWFLFIVLRFVLRRDVGSLGISDFLFIVIIGDAAQNGMIGSATSATDGMVLIATLVFWSYLLDFVSFQFPLFQRFTSAPRLCLVRDGKLLRKNMRREFITDEELNAKIRHEGVEDVATVKRMYLEADGEMSLIRNEGTRAAA